MLRRVRDLVQCRIPVRLRERVMVEPFTRPRLAPTYTGGALPSPGTTTGEVPLGGLADIGGAEFVGLVDIDGAELAGVEGTYAGEEARG